MGHLGTIRAAWFVGPQDLTEHTGSAGQQATQAFSDDTGRMCFTGPSGSIGMACDIGSRGSHGPLGPQGQLGFTGEARANENICPVASPGLLTAIAISRVNQVRKI
jgi:hypothetical protein